MAGLLGGRATAAQALTGLRRRIPRDGVGRVWVFTGLLALLAVAVYVLAVAGQAPLPTSISVPWWLLAGLFYVAEVKVVHFHFRRDAHSFSLSELPLVLGLFFVPPSEFVLAQVVGAGAALLIHRRQSPLKLSFNLAHFALEAALAVAVFRGLIAVGAGFGLIAWVAAFAAMLVANVVGVLAIGAAISLSEGRGQYDRLPRMLGMALGVSLTNTSLALVGVTILLTQASAIWLLAVPVVTLFLAYRAYIGERQKHESLELLYESSRILQRSPELDSAMVELLDHARRMFRAERAEITLYPTGPEDEALRTVVGPDDENQVMVPVAFDAGGELAGRLSADGRAFIFSRPADHDGPAAHDVRNAMVSPLRTDSGVIGEMAVVNRMGDVSSFDAEDLRLFETVANQAGIALENGQLEQSLSELSRLKEALRFQAYHDGLTSLGNRALFVEQVEARLAALTDVHAVPVVLFLDLDDFKIVNDSLGHACGDALLVVVAERLRQCLRDDDVAARLGGDEFAVLLSDTPDLTSAVAVAQRIIDSLHPPFQIDGHDVVVTASIGVAARTFDERAEELLRNADVAMYTAKARGKGRLALFEPTMHAAVVQVRQLSSELQRAVGSDEFLLHYQPIVDLATGRITGVEALVRWRHPQRGLVEPAEFVALAEDTGVIIPIGRWVLAEACRQLRLWQRSLARPDLTIAVNLSARQVQHPGFIEEVAQALLRSGLDAGSLVLEMTETVMLQDTQASISKLEALKQMGLRIAVDDFGTGYSSLSYLRRFPVDILKIARDFVDIDRAGSGEWAFADAIIALGRSLGMEIVAEGIERVDQLGRLRELGCQFGQGYYFARPLDAYGIEALLAAEDGRWAPASENLIPFNPQARSSVG